PMSWQAYAQRIGAAQKETEALEREINDRLQVELEKGRAMTKPPPLRTLPEYWDGYRGGPYDPALEVDTSVPQETLERIARGITTVPPGFYLHSKVGRGLEQRLEMALARRAVDFGMAEALAYDTVVLGVTPVGLRGLARSH